ncbi:lysylphosphatidylglycerol synthase transmembrane domain-containing protein [Bacteriovorax sp. PP10]|uniref:Lysylphosphatidylglycerol synthase transmembrane domain-containing protein n=1 Tax=Bacteriovorax antarcticus TaxID=3088717 RepID=A0ABU5VUL9_9BACT|nr:lysylphosphatidylglycerol synthase transmembrane domain-containing protein [Bacteriovorax sp. PP10]MEA9356751.1 lysylphosphatidylglycerol synthase transmembrane domain-containing protein [Bacteriovorax sp. PP10]
MLKTFLKFSFALVLCYWLFKNGKLDFSLLSQAFHLGYLWIWGVILLVSRLLFCPLRFKILLDTKSKTPVPYLKVFAFDAIGNLFSVILPGAAAGDVVRFFYYKNVSSEVTSGMIAAFLTIDRLIGLMGLMGLAIAVTAFNYTSFIQLSPQLVSLFIINAAVFIFLCIFMFFIFSKWFPKKKIESILAKCLHRWPKALVILTDILNIELGFSNFIKCFILSVLNQTFVVAGFWLLISPFIPESTSFLKVFTILPIGFIGSSLPIAPAGLGVGHVLFDNLFRLIQIDNGASLFNIFFVVNIFVCLLGLIPYLIVRAESHDK